MLPLEGLHPGDRELTRELAALCRIQEGSRVLDVACGTGETACFLAETPGGRVRGVDRSEAMIRRAEAKSRERGLSLELTRADGAALPYADGAFDAVICECTLCLMDKEPVHAEMARVTRPGGRIGMHDLCWKEDAPVSLKRTLAENEGERPETLEGWRGLFARAGMAEIQAVDRSELIERWVRDSRRRLGTAGRLALSLKIVRRWGLAGLLRVLQSERVFSSKHLGYGLVSWTKR